MRMFKVFYYYFHLFYTQVIPDEQPNATVVFTLSFIQSLWVSILIDIIAILLFGYNMNKWIRIFITILLIVFNYWYFYKYNNVQEIINSKPSFFRNKKITIVFVLLFSLTGISWMFWGGIFAKNILGK